MKQGRERSRPLVLSNPSAGAERAAKGRPYGRIRNMQGPMPHRPGMPLTGWDISPSADGEFLLQRCKRNQKIARGPEFSGKTCGWRLGLSGTPPPGPPILRGYSTEHCDRGRRGRPQEGCPNLLAAALLCDLSQVLLPVYSAPAWCSIHRGRGTNGRRRRPLQNGLANS